MESIIHQKTSQPLNGLDIDKHQSEKIKSVLRAAYITAILCVCMMFISNATLKFVAITQLKSSITCILLGLSAGYGIGAARMAALLWSVADAIRGRYYSAAIGVIVSIAFAWHELSTSEMALSALRIESDLAKSSYKMLLVATLLIEARLITGLFRK